MNVRMVLYTMGQVLRVFAVFLIVPLVTAAVSGETSARSLSAFLVPMIVCLALGSLLCLRRPSDTSFYAREGLIIVGFGWIAISLLGALPFAIGTYGDPRFADLTYVDWLFESISGFTTTGSSVLHSTPYGHQVDIMYESGYRGLLMWRSLAHWIGGMGILVFILAVLPSVSMASGIHLMQAESPGPTVDKLVSRMRGTARILYLIYAAMTLLQIGLLLIAIPFDGAMNVFHAVIVSFGTAGTGGFAATSGNIGDFGPYVRAVVAVFMFLFAVNFNIYYMILLGRLRAALGREELRFYFFMVVASIALVTVNVWLAAPDYPGMTPGLGGALGDAAFAVVSCVTSTGFATADFSYWPAFSRALLLLLMFIGGNAGSTCGGFKCSRFLILVKSVVVRCRKTLSPNGVYTVRLDGKRVADETVRGVNGYFVLYAAILLAATLLLCLDPCTATTGQPLLTAFSSSVTCFNNVGPGMTTLVGPMGDFSAYALPSTLLLGVLMLCGRLEIYPILMLFSPRTYRRTA